MAQDPELINNQWFLEKIVVSGTEVFPPVNEEVPNVPLYFEDNVVGIVFLSTVCNSLSGIPEFDGNNSFTLTELYQTLGGCDDGTNSPFEGEYFQFYFSNEMNEPYIYEITDEGGGGRSMTITVTNGDVAYYKNSVLSIEDQYLLSSKIVPNPITSSFSIHSVVAIQKLEIYDLSGNLLYSEEHPNNTIDISSFSAGIYFAEITIGNQKSVQKLIKE